MKLWFKILSVVVITFCFGTRALSGEATFEGRKDAMAECFISTRLDREFTLSDLADAYDFVGSSFILSGQVDLPGDEGVDKEKGGLFKLLSYQDSVLKSHHAICKEKFREYLVAKHIQGFYTYWVGRLVI